MKFLWDVMSTVIFILGMMMIFKACSDDYQTTLKLDKIDSIYSVVTRLNTKVDSLEVKKKTLISKEKLIHEEHTKTIERILITADSSQHFITEELIRKHRELDNKAGN
jgi:outer membrane murein-binding lipoprotein Lpp